MPRSDKAAKTVLVIVVFTIASKVLGYVRDMLIAAKFGSGATTDTFFIALSAVTLLINMITKAVNTTTIPVLSEIESLEGKAGKKRHTTNLINITLMFSVVLVVLSWVFAPLLLRVLAYGFEGEQFDLAVALLRIGLFSILFTGCMGVFRGYLQSEQMFTESALTSLPFNFVYIAFLLFFAGRFGIKGLMTANVLAVGAQLLIQFPGLSKGGYRYSWEIDFKDRYVKKVFGLIPPILISIVINDINVMVDTSLASTLIDGSISALKYASRLNSLVTGIFISAIITVLFPLLAQEAHKDSYDRFKSVVRQGINTILLIIIPAAVGILVLAEPIVKFAFQRGAFDAKATAMTVGALVFYALGLVGVALKSFANRVYYSLQDTKTPMLNGFIAVGANIVFNFILIGFMAHRGLALATSLSSILSTAILLWGLRKKIGSVGFGDSLVTGLKSLGAALAMGIVVHYCFGALSAVLGAGFTRGLLALAGAIGLGAVVYLLLVYLLKVKEIAWLAGVIRSKLKRV